MTHAARNSDVDNAVPELRLWLDSDEPQRHLASLNNWLVQEDELRGCVELHRRPIAPGEMGGALDVIAVALGSGGAIAVLAQSVSTWLTQRRADISATIATQDGREITIDVRRAKDPMLVLSELEKLARDTKE